MDRRELERATGIEPVLRAWKALVQPLHHARGSAQDPSRVRAPRRTELTAALLDAATCDSARVVQSIEGGRVREPQDIEETAEATLTDDEIETRRLGGTSPSAAPSADDGDDTGDTGDDTGDPSDPGDTGDDSGDASDTGDDSGSNA
jgi:hypothetical protein